MDSIRNEENRLDQEQENTHGDYNKMKLVLEKKINLYKRYLKKEGLPELDRLRLENKKEWQMSHLLSLIMHKETTSKISNLTQRVYMLEKAAAGLE